MKNPVVKRAFVHHYGHGGSVNVPAGAALEPIADEPGVYWVDPVTFPAGTLERHDATHRGIRVWRDNARDRAPTEVDVYRGWTLHADTDGAWAVRDPVDPIARASNADALYGVIDELTEEN